MIARILDFSLSGYGLVCDSTFLKIIFHQVRYLHLRVRNFLVRCYTTPLLRKWYLRAGEKLAELINLEEDEKWYLRGR